MENTAPDFQEGQRVTWCMTAGGYAFTVLVTLPVDGQLRAAVLSHNNQQIAYHRFDREPGDADYWRDARKLAELECAAAPQCGGARPGSGRRVIGDARHNVTLPADVAGYLRELGGSGLSAGIIEVVRRLRG
ncbi:hypothetical protein ACQVRV_00095 (plasmid) [Ralstonia pseudosolanacearum]